MSSAINLNIYKIIVNDEVGIINFGGNVISLFKKLMLGKMVQYFGIEHIEK